MVVPCCLLFAGVLFVLGIGDAVYFVFWVCYLLTSYYVFICLF